MLNSELSLLLTKGNRLSKTKNTTFPYKQKQKKKMQPQAIKKFPDTNIIYLYDLPNKTFTSTALAKVIKDKTGYNLEHMPQVRRDPGKPFYTAVIKIDNPDKFLEVSQKLRYF